MKNFLLVLSLVLTANAFGQKGATQVILTKGQKFSVQTTLAMDADMGMGMQMKNNSTTQNKFYVIDSDDKNYSISNTLTGVKMSMEFMGQSSTYDSDLKEDSASEIGKSMTTLNVPDTVSISRFSGEINSDKKPKAETKADPTNPMESLFESMGNANTNAVLSEAFFVIPAGKKAGDSWVDSSSTKDQKSVKTYNIKSIDKNIATLNVKTTVENNVQTETQGMQITVNMTTKTDSEVITDIKTSLVSKKTSKADISGTLELMGQSMPVTGKSTIVSVYSY